MTPRKGFAHEERRRIQELPQRLSVGICAGRDAVVAHIGIEKHVDAKHQQELLLPGLCHRIPRHHRHCCR